MALFDVSAARAWDKAQLTSATLYPDATIEAREIAIRSKFERIIGVSLSATEHTEYFDGDGGNLLMLRHHNPYAESTPRPVTLTSITTIATDDTETAFTADELTNTVKTPGYLVRRSGRFPRGRRNVKVVYTTGYVDPPQDIIDAALWACIEDLMPSSIPSNAIDGSEMQGAINWSKVKDPERGRWWGNESVDAVLREHRALETLPGIA